MTQNLIMNKLGDIRSSGRRIAGVVIILVALVISVIVIKELARDIPVWFFGTKVKATIMDRWTDRYPDDINPVYYLSYEFTTLDGETITGSTRVPGDEWITYVDGMELAVKYSGLNPENNRLDDSRYMPFLFCAYIPFLLFCWFAITLGKEMVE